MSFPSITLAVPGWVEDFLAGSGPTYPGIEQRMGLAIELSRRSMAHGGGPFGAAVFDLASGRLIAPGVNLVVPANCSTAHAEIVALSIAQQVLGSFDLGARGIPACELVTSTAPCALCFGAIPWSGVRQVVCGARSADAESIGFHEGNKPKDWEQVLEAQGIRVVSDVLREQAKAVLDAYKAQGLPIYNAVSGGEAGGG